jgi:hypothetical protein
VLVVLVEHQAQWALLALTQFSQQLLALVVGVVVVTFLIPPI